MKKELLDEVEKNFRPEFLNRLDEIIVFQSLAREDLREIIDIEMAHVAERLKSQGIEVELTNGAKDFLIEIGYNPEYGARPLRRAIEQYLEDPLAEELLRGGLNGKTMMRIEAGEGRLLFKAQEVVTDEAEEAEEEATTVGSGEAPVETEE